LTVRARTNTWTARGRSASPFRGAPVRAAPRAGARPGPSGSPMTRHASLSTPTGAARARTARITAGRWSVAGRRSVGSVSCLGLSSARRC
jgi:hypothetical protein